MRQLLITGLLVLLGSSAASAASGYYPMYAAWPQTGGPGSPITVTFSFSDLLNGSIINATTDTPLSATALRGAFMQAFTDYADVLPIHFVEQPDAGPLPETGEYDPSGLADIRIGQVPNVDGANAYAYFPAARDSGLAGDIVFNARRFGFDWSLTLFYAVTQHELGHSLGMGHFVAGEVGAPTLAAADYPGPVFPLDPAMITALQTVYGAGVGSVTAVPLPASFSSFMLGILTLMAGRFAARQRVSV